MGAVSYVASAIWLIRHCILTSGRKVIQMPQIMILNCFSEVLIDDVVICRYSSASISISQVKISAGNY